MSVEDLMRQCNGMVSPSKALIKGVATSGLAVKPRAVFNTS